MGNITPVTSQPDHGGRTGRLNRADIHESVMGNSELVRERISVLRNLNDPGLLIIHDLHQSRDHLYLVRERVPGLTLAALRGHHEGLQFAQVAGFIAQCLPTLQTLHNAGVIHGDISPANIVVYSGPGNQLRQTGQPVFLDYFYPPVSHVGTPGFRGPEVRSGAFSASSDVYALAATAMWLVRDADRPRLREVLADALHPLMHSRMGLADLAALVSGIEQEPLPLYDDAAGAAAQLRALGTLEPTTHADAAPLDSVASADTGPSARARHRGEPRYRGKLRQLGALLTRHWAVVTVMAVLALASVTAAMQMLRPGTPASHAASQVVGHTVEQASSTPPERALDDRQLPAQTAPTASAATDLGARALELTLLRNEWFMDPDSLAQTSYAVADSPVAKSDRSLVAALQAGNNAPTFPEVALETFSHESTEHGTVTLSVGKGDAARCVKLVLQEVTQNSVSEWLVWEVLACD